MCPIQYDAENIGRFGGGGEYVVQEGFGWTNGLVFELLAKYSSKGGSSVGGHGTGHGPGQDISNSLAMSHIVDRVRKGVRGGGQAAGQAAEAVGQALRPLGLDQRQGEPDHPQGGSSASG